MNIGVRVPLQISVFIFFRYIPKSRFVGLCGRYSFLVFRGESILLSIGAAPIYIPTNSLLGCLFSTFSPTVIRDVFDDCHSDRYEVISHCGLY